ncbi:hypothetical protein [Giesbergeria anulus]|uniref:Uncharacterized protein n=1 Tax=Giesbergeria anulus TaxID=180197 RepID=A0A1H9PUU6_9BURK|nr:hypothetical protein [Giesbergeria anulus]SER51942.1 hypothetical protein SAMN02982919_02534 [Giesbergeria anulus]
MKQSRGRLKQRTYQGNQVHLALMLHFEYLMTLELGHFIGHQYFEIGCLLAGIAGQKNLEN